MTKYLTLFFISLGLAFGGGLAYLLLTNEVAQLVALIVAVVFFTIVMWGLPLLYVIHRLTRSPENITQYNRFPSGQPPVVIVQPSQPGQLPAPNWYSDTQYEPEKKEMVVG